MLIPHENLLHKPVMSLQTGVELARTKDILIDPRTLTVVAYELEGRMLDAHPSFLRIEEIREYGALGFIVDSSDEFVGLDDVLKLKEIYEFNFSLIGLDVAEQKGSKLGKVHAYAVDGSAYAVQQLMVKRPLLKSFTETELIVHRSQVIEVNNSRVLVRSTAHKQETVLQNNVKSYANPFRQSQPAGPDSIDTNH